MWEGKTYPAKCEKSLLIWIATFFFILSLSAEQVGQCGNQIGTRFWEMALHEYAHCNPKGIYDETMARY